VPLPAAIGRDAARARLGLPPGAAVLASFGHINAWKRVEPTLRALAALRADGRDARYILVGSVSPNYDLAGLVARSRLGDAVTITGHVPREQFEDYVAAADICVNLRHPTGGETSASLLRLLGAGQPTLVSAVGSFAELPSGVAAQVDPGPAEGDQILAYCRLLLGRPALAAALGARARAFVAAEHTLAGAAAGYARFLARLYRWPAVARARERPLWEVGVPTTDDRRPTTAGPVSALASGGLAAAALPSSVVGGPSSEPGAALPLAELITATARAAASLGLTEDDSVVLEALAQRIAEMGDGPEAL
jgi:hypothetical protein